MHKSAVAGLVVLALSGRIAAGKPPQAQTLDTKSLVTISDDGSQLLIRCGDLPLTTYVYTHQDVLRPFFAHVKAPGGIQVTRNFPPVNGQDPTDHATMHPGIWMAFGDISGEDFWRNKGRVVHQRFTDPPTGGPGAARFAQRKSWQRADGSVVCHEDFRCTVRILPAGYLIEWDSTFSPADNTPFTFGDQEEMGLGIRVATPISELKTGRITDSEHRTGAKAVWSQSSKWCDYSGQIDKQSVGITILCHPENFRKSWMHARNYGLIAANPFGRKAMNKGPASRVIVKPGESLRLRYGLFLHREVSNLDQVYSTYVNLNANDSP